MTAEVLRDLARAKVTFQLRALAAIIRGPASVDTRRMAETAKTGSGRSPSGAALNEVKGDAQ